MENKKKLKILLLGNIDNLKKYEKFFNIKHDTIISTSMKGQNFDFRIIDNFLDLSISENYEIYCNTNHLPTLAIGEGAIQISRSMGINIIEFVDTCEFFNSNQIFYPVSLNNTPKLYGDSEINVSSRPMKMINPYHLNTLKYEIIGWSKYFKSVKYLDIDYNEIELPLNFLEIEIIKYNDCNILAIFFDILNLPSDTDNLILYNIISNFTNKSISI